MAHSLGMSQICTVSLQMWRSWNHGTPPLWMRELLGKGMGYGWQSSHSLSLSRHSGDFIPRIDLTPLEIVFNKPHPSILLHVPDGTTRKILILFLQEIKRDIIFRRAQLAEPRRREELPPRIQAPLLSVISKLQSFLEYQGVLNYTDALALLRRMAHSTLHD